MPIPYPREDEKKKDFIDRCLNDDGMMLEYRDMAERYEVCNVTWQNSGEAARRERGENVYRGERLFTETEE